MLTQHNGGYAYCIHRLNQHSRGNHKGAWTLERWIIVMWMKGKVTNDVEAALAREVWNNRDGHGVCEY